MGQAANDPSPSGVGFANDSELVHEEGLEPPHLAVPEPKSGASANSATRAFGERRHSAGARGASSGIGEAWKLPPSRGLDASGGRPERLLARGLESRRAKICRRKSSVKPTSSTALRRFCTPRKGCASALRRHARVLANPTRRRATPHGSSIARGCARARLLSLRDGCFICRQHIITPHPCWSSTTIRRHGARRVAF